MEAIDLGLSVKWASCNIGAVYPSEIGDLFAFGEISSKKIFTNENYSTDIMLEGYCSDVGLKRLTYEYDAAHIILGGKWRMPTRDEVAELIENSNLEMFRVDGVIGTQVWGQNGNSIFIPNEGRKVVNDLFNNGELSYWLSTIRIDSNHLSCPDFMGGLGFLKVYIGGVGYKGKCIRAVMDF